MSRIKEAFKDKKIFIGFLTAGDPSLDKTEEYIVEIAKSGAGLIEIGIPFSDPIAEGPIVQDANVRALSAPGGCTTDMVFDMVERASKKVDCPLVFLTYLNPVYKYGYERFFKRCQEVGIDGVIIPDIPYEEKGEVSPVAAEYGVDIISIIAPAEKERISMIAKEATGYIYVIPPRNSVDADGNVSDEAISLLDSIRNVTDVPLVMEFEINTKEGIAKCSQAVDGVIINNSIVKIISEHGDKAHDKLCQYVETVVKAVEG